MKLEKLRLKHIAIDKELRKVDDEISELLEGTFKYRGEECSVEYYSTEEDSILLESTNGSTISGFSDQVSLTFKKFEEIFGSYKYKIHFYEGMEAFGQVLEHFQTVEVELDSEPSSDKEVVLEGLKIVGSYPKSYTAKVYKVGEV